eukprot:6378426-Amphidinium_carterae.1
MARTKFGFDMLCCFMMVGMHCDPQCNRCVIMFCATVEHHVAWPTSLLDYFLQTTNTCSAMSLQVADQHTLRQRKAQDELAKVGLLRAGTMSQVMQQKTTSNNMNVVFDRRLEKWQCGRRNLILKKPTVIATTCRDRHRWWRMLRACA